MPTLERPTVTVSYRDEGQGDPALVFLHGWCDDSGSWGATLSEFSQGHRCLAPDMRGHGQSGQPRDHSYWPESLSNDVVAICEAAGVERPVLIGHSFGGFLAATVAQRFPGFARAIVVEDQPLDLRGFTGQMRTVEGVIRSPEHHMAFRDQLFESMITSALGPADRDLISRSKLATPVEVGQALWAPLFDLTEAEIAARSDALIDALAAQPSLVIDGQPQPEYHALVARRAPSARTMVIPSGHWIHLEHAPEFRAALREFVGSL